MSETQTIEFEKIDRMELAHTGQAPKIGDVETMYRLCKKVPGADILWIWQGKNSDLTYTLCVQYPVIKQTGWWDYEVRDDPIWKITDNREHGNNEIWKQKTCDTELAVLYCNMAESHANQEAATNRELEAAPVSTLATPVFSEIFDKKQITYDDQLDRPESIQPALSSCAQKRYTGKIVVSSNHEVGHIYFDLGVPVHAYVSVTTGDPAVHEIVSWQTGIVTQEQGSAPNARTITKDIETLIGEGLGFLELKRRLASNGITYESYLVKTGKPFQQNPSQHDPVADILLREVERKCTLFDIIRDQCLAPFQWAPALSSLLSQECIEVKPAVTERATALKSSRLPRSGIDSQVNNLWNQKTGIFRFEALLLFLVREYSHFQLDGHPISLMILDVKKEGAEVKAKWVDDELARLIGRKIELVKRPLDLFCHYETTDFALLLPNTSMAQATMVAKRILQMVSGLTPLGDDAAGLTAYCGIASLPENGKTIESLFRRATRALDHGRNIGRTLVTGEDRDIPVEIEEPREEAPYPELTGKGVETDTEEKYIDMKGLLTRSGIVNPDQFDQAEIISRNMQTSLARVLAMQGIGVDEKTVQAAEEVKSMIDSREISVADGIRVAELIGGQELDLNTALKRVGAVKRQNPIADLLSDAGIVDKTELDRALNDSNNMALPLGMILVSKGLVSRTLIHNTIDAIRLVRYGSMNEGDAARALQATQAENNTLKEHLDETGVDTSDISTKSIGILLQQAELINDGEFASAREIALTSTDTLRAILDDQGLVDEKCLSAADELLDQVRSDRLTMEDAATKLAAQMAPPKITEPRRKDGKKAAVSKGAGQAPGQRAARTHDMRRPSVEQTKPAQTSQRPRRRPTQEELDRRAASLDRRHRPSIEIPKGKKQPRVIDRLFLLRRADIITDNDVRGARKRSAASDMSPIQVLFSFGVIDQKDLNITGSAKKHIDAGDVDLARAIKIIKYCKEKSVSFDTGMEEVE